MDVTNIFTVTPMNQKIELTPGEVYHGSIMVSNPATAKEDFNYNIEIMPYGVSGDGYDADLVTESARTQMTNWIVLKDTKGTLKPNEVKTIDFEIHTPADAGAGGQYAALTVSFSGKQSENGGLNINNKFELASLIYAEVGGDIVHQGNIESSSVPGFVTDLPIQTNVVLKNDGNIHETARISLEVRSVFSPEVIYPRAGESSNIEEVVMPETTHEVKRDIVGISPLGIYEVTQTVTYLGETSTIKQTVVACPIWFMVLIAITIATIVAFITGVVVKNRRKKEIL